MGKNKKNRNQNKANLPKGNVVAPVAPVVPERPTIENVKATSATSEEAKHKIDELILSRMEEIDKYEAQVRQARENAEKANQEKEQIVRELTQLRGEKENCEKELAKAKKDKEELEEEAKGIIDKADKKAAEISENAEKEKLRIISEANEEARNAWKTEVDNLKRQLADIPEREAKLEAAEQDLKKRQRSLGYQEEDLREREQFVEKRKELYLSASPDRIESLNSELAEERAKYSALKARHDEQTAKLAELQVLLDSIQTEIVETSGKKKNVGLGQLVATLQKIKKDYNALRQSIGDLDAESIEELKTRAERVLELEHELESLEEEKNARMREAKAAANARRELEVIKHEVDATNALNEHLLHELESHKTALESRTGDTCPALTKVDAEMENEEYIDSIRKRQQRDRLSSLEEIVRHVKNYAGSRKGQQALYYRDDDIRAFLAGLAVSRLLILQGMSGTGKSSLPRIFAEAISGFNRLIPVESSWRDRNELLGYYNDFNKKFNAKTFTIELYRSCKECCREFPTFIVLDEMNLARIEYYFSDFLAILQEPDPQAWRIELVSSDMRTLPMELPEDIKKQMADERPNVFEIWKKLEQSRSGNPKALTTDEEKEELSNYLARMGQLTGAKDLLDGRKIRVTENIWFIGTANRDESTFEISDKVYDRAQVVSLNRRGEPENSYGRNNKPRIISVLELIDLFEEAIKGNTQKSEIEARLKALDSVLIDKFDVSFGNRIVNQTINFAAVFIKAGGKLDDALDYQISTKILRKVITSDDVDALLTLQGALRPYKEACRIIEKRLKELN